jgi:rubrerythrin
MTNDDVLTVLIDLCRLDIDAVGAYEIALKNIDDVEVYNQIDKFRQDHERHIERLNNLIGKYGSEPQKKTPDFKGYLIEGMTALRSITGLEGALKAMETNEVMTNKKYREALEESPNLPEEVKNLLNENFTDEKRHLAYIREVLSSLAAV